MQKDWPPAVFQGSFLVQPVHLFSVRLGSLRVKCFLSSHSLLLVSIKHDLDLLVNEMSEWEMPPHSLLVSSWADFCFPWEELIILWETLNARLSLHKALGTKTRWPAGTWNQLKSETQTLHRSSFVLSNFTVKDMQVVQYRFLSIKLVILKIVYSIVILALLLSNLGIWGKILNSLSFHFYLLNLRFTRFQYMVSAYEIQKDTYYNYHLLK